MFSPPTTDCIAEVKARYCTYRFLGLGPVKSTRKDVLVLQLMHRYQKTVAYYHIQVCDIDLNNDNPKQVKTSLLSQMDELIASPSILEKYGRLVYSIETTTGYIRQKLYAFITKITSE